MSYRKYGFPTYGLRFFPTRQYSSEDIPDLSGKVAVVTGGTSGLGLESAIQMALHDADVYILGSSETRGKQAIETIRAKTGKTVKWQYLNLASIKAARDSGRELRKKLSKIDILLLNAGTGSGKPIPSDEGYEHIFALNHLGHFAFVQPLMDTFTGSDVRIAVLSSAIHYDTKAIDYSALEPSSTAAKAPAKQRSKVSTSMQAYGVSKLANLMYARALQRRVGPNVYVNAVHPGVVATNIIDDSELDDYGMFAGTLAAIVRFCFVYLGLKVEDGALTQLYCCTSPDISKKGHKGDYFVPIAVEDSSSKAAEDVDAQEKLWKFSEEAVAKVAG